MLQMSSSSDYERHKNNNNSSSSNNGRSSRNKKKGAPFMFFTNILRKKKVLSIDEIKEMKTRTRSEPSVVSYSCSLPVGQPSISTLSLTPGRILSRDIDHADMQQLRLSRSDNPYLQKKLASRDEMNMIDIEDNLVDDDTILIQDLNSQIDSGFEPDPFLLPDVQEHMIRSPPPVSWRPHGSSVFNFPHDNNNTITSHSSDESTQSVHGFYSENFTKQPSRISFDKVV
ncbi:hypothetical protein ACKWTF_012584 [Chironomus riparius]